MALGSTLIPHRGEPRPSHTHEWRASSGRACPLRPLTHTAAPIDFLPLSPASRSQSCSPAARPGRRERGVGIITLQVRNVCSILDTCASRPRNHRRAAPACQHGRVLPGRCRPSTYVLTRFRTTSHGQRERNSPTADCTRHPRVIRTARVQYLPYYALTHPQHTLLRVDASAHFTHSVPS